MRAAAPLVANKREPSSLPAESVAADKVVDGIALLKLAGYDGTNQPDEKQLTSLIDAAARTAMAPVLGDSSNLIDALADLLLAEAVDHTLAGTPMRASAAADLLAGGPVGVPDEIEVARIGQRGIATTHKILALFESEGAGAARWTATPQAAAEPALEDWPARQLPDPSTIAIVAAIPIPGGAATPVATTLATLFATAKAHCGLGAIDIVLLKASVVKRRVAALLEPKRPAGSVGPSTLLPDAKREGRTGDWLLAEVAELAATLCRLLGGARGLVPADLDALGQAAGATLDTREFEKRLSALRIAAVAARDELPSASNYKARLGALEVAELLAIDAIPSVGPLEAAATSVLKTVNEAYK